MSYRTDVLRTANLDANSSKDRLCLAALGLAGETGEVVDLLKKVIFHDKDLDTEALIKEIGDVRWYLEYLAATIDVTMEEIENKNIEKLKKRYPQGFSYEAANNKVNE